MKKGDLRRKILEYLKENDVTQQNFIIQAALDLPKPEVIGVPSLMKGSDKDVLLANEIIWDLIAERILTPGVNKENLDLPHLRVTNFGIIEKELRGI